MQILLIRTPLALASCCSQGKAANTCLFISLFFCLSWDLWIIKVRCCSVIRQILHQIWYYIVFAVFSCGSTLFLRVRTASYLFSVLDIKWHNLHMVFQILSNWSICSPNTMLYLPAYLKKFRHFYTLRNTD